MDEKILVNKQLDTWLEEQDQNLFPAHADYKARYKVVAEYLDREVHTEVEKGNILAQIAGGVIGWDNAIYLNNHGPGHVAAVIKLASKLLESAKCRISPYEAYILLAAIQFHDVGNIYGREQHESKCKNIMEKLGPLLGGDRPEKNAVAKIAAAHAGCNDGDEDTIWRLEEKHPLLGQYVRKRYLAAVLRFADELADDRTRASHFLLKEGRIPPSSELFHAYSNSLHTVVIDSSEVVLRFEIDKTTASSTFDKKKVYLFDEILRRTLKMHRERAYCMRFVKPDMDVSRIRVRIEVCSDISPDTISHVLEPIEYSLEEKGYPPGLPGGIYALCPELRGKDGKWLKQQLK